MHQRDSNIAFLLSCALLFSGCGGNSQSSNSDRPIVPLFEEYYDLETQEVSHRIQYDYSTPLQIQSYYLTPGDDGLWDTDDDIRSPHLLCRYAVDADNLPYQRFLLQAAFTRSPTGASLIAAAGLFDGITPQCPLLKGHYLKYMEHCSDCPASEGVYQLIVSRERQGNTLIDTQTLQIAVDNVTITDYTQTQETRITIDAKGRPTSIDINTTQTNFFDEMLANICEDGPDFSIALLLYRSCHAFRKSVRYRYKHEGIFRDVDYYHGWNYSFTSRQQRIIDKEAKTLTINTIGSFSDRHREQPEYVYHFNDQEKITSFQIRRPGEDQRLHTKDDQILNVIEYVYNDNGDLEKATTDSGIEYEYFYDEKNRLQEEAIYFSDSEAPTIKTVFSHNNSRRITKTVYFKNNENEQKLVKTSKTHYRLAPEGTPFTFQFDGSNSHETMLETILDIFDVPLMRNSMD